MRLHHLLISATALFSIFTPTSAFWRLPCDKPISVQRADPIVQPGQIGSHVHTIMGASRFSATSTPETIRQSNCSTCKVIEDKSNYWIGQLYHQWENGSYTSVPQIGGMLVYYLQRQDSKDKEYPKIRAFPRGFQMIAGTPSRRTYDVSEKDSHGTFNNTALEERAVSYACLNYAQGSPETKAFPTVNCPQGLRTQVFFPSCWDGVNLDSADHKSHVHYPDRVDNGICPPSHPVRLISIFYEVTFDINKFKDSWIGADGKPFRPFPFVWSTGDQTGTSHHADFMDGWETDVLQKAVDECTDASGVVEKCQHFHYSPNFGNKCMLETTPMADEKVLGTFPVGTPLPGQKMTTPLTFSTYTTPYVGNGTIQGNTNYDDYYGTTTPPTNNGNGQGSTTNIPTTPPTNNGQGSTGINMNDATSVSVASGVLTLLLATIAILQ